MAHLFRKILCPIQFDDPNCLKAVALAHQIAKEHNASICLMHAVPMIIVSPDVPVYRDVYRPEEEAATEKLRKLASDHLGDVKAEIVTRIGDPAKTIIGAAAELGIDLLVIATHGRRGVSHLFLGSVAERVVREAPCPVLTIRADVKEPALVRQRMTQNPVTLSPEDTLATAQQRMNTGTFHSLPVIDHGRIVGIVLRRDLAKYEGYLDRTKVDAAMSSDVSTVGPGTSIDEAARAMIKRKLDALPVVDNGKLVGIITSSDLLEALIA
jgi:universal stress protein A